MSKRKRLDSSESFEKPSARVRVASKSSGLCLRCSDLSWSSISHESDNKLQIDKFVLYIHESHEDLQASPCRVCQLFALLKPSMLDSSRCSLRAVSASRLFMKQDKDKLPYSNLRDTTLLYIVSEGNERKPKTRRHMGHILAVAPPVGSSPILQPRHINHKAIDFDLIRSWRDYCSNYHSACCQPERLRPVENFKVINCKGEEPIVELASANCKYAALSYVWGNAALDQEKFPQVVIDSIRVVKELGCNYLWVDRHCNDQEGPFKDEQIRRMDEIYSGAEFTIIDAAGKDCHFGLAGVTNPRQPDRPQGYAEINGVKLIYLGTPPRDKIAASRWASRGWTYQEGILSRRRIFFTDEQVMFQCNNMTCLESFAIPMNLMHTPDGTKARRGPVLDDIEPLKMGDQQLAGHLMQYSRRDLTKEEDSLNAFLGILNLYTRQESYAHFLGNPIHRERGNMFNAWHHVKPATRRCDFPSWSWTGWEGEVNLTSRNNPDYEIRLVTKRGESMSVDEFAKLCHAAQPPDMEHFIKLKGNMTTLSFELIEWGSEPDVIRNRGRNEPELPDGVWAILPLTTDITCYSLLYLDEKSLMENHRFRLPVIILELGKSSRDHNIVILVMRKMGDGFERVGLVTIRDSFKLTSKDRDWGTDAKKVVYKDKTGRWLTRAPISEPPERIWLQGVEKKTILLR